MEFNSKGQRTNYTLRILEKSQQGHREVSRLRAMPEPFWGMGGVAQKLLRPSLVGPVLTVPSLLSDWGVVL